MRDLNPFQLNNHIEKSLLILENKPKPIYSTYNKICNFFKSIHSFVANHFVEYMTILKYIGIDDFSLAFSAHKEIRNGLAIQFAEKILKLVSEGDIDNRNQYMKRLHVSYDYLREINLKFNKENIELWLSFGSTQNSARRMLSRIDDITINDSNFYYFSYGFHLIDTWGKIKNDLYGCESYKWKWKCPKEYFDYWKVNIAFLRKSNPNDVVELYNQLYKDGKIDNDFLNAAKKILLSSKKGFSIVPEFSIVFQWDYETASDLGLESFASSIREKVNLSLIKMKLL